jgi:hypothetical protein
MFVALCRSTRELFIPAPNIPIVCALHMELGFESSQEFAARGLKESTNSGVES